MLAHQKITGKIDSYLSRFEVTSTQISILLLLVISENGFETPGSISRKLGLSNPTISNVIKTLNKKELVKKEVSEKDKRFCNICITSKGLIFLNEVMSEYHLKYERLLMNFTSEELKAPTIASEKLGFHVGPLINSKGRLEHPEASLQLLICDNHEKARVYYDLLTNH